MKTQRFDRVRWASDERKLKDKDSCGGLPTNENPKIKIRSGRFRLSKERKKLKIRFSGLSKNNGKPRFISLVSRVGSDKQKKTKDSFGGFPKDQDS
ncbi:uncharacterized protein OCT59_009811 [Rhizophagus irregularis]|uniref:uncharacterized protein n=1 Tax=Rhizophagus irregularis TaxID=588596 RepID=UPI00331F74BC|nr:hypothetical protein OCT59_009811 [Rhizophagus irregularis]